MRERPATITSGLVRTRLDGTVVVEAFNSQSDGRVAVAAAALARGCARATRHAHTAMRKQGRAPRRGVRHRGGVVVMVARTGLVFFLRPFLNIFFDTTTGGTYFTE